MYHVIQVRMSVLVVQGIGHAQRIFTVAMVTATDVWELVRIKHGVIPRVHSFYVSLSFPVNILIRSLSNSTEQQLNLMSLLLTL